MFRHITGVRPGAVLAVFTILTAPVAAQTLTLEEAQQLAVISQPLLDSRQASIVAARESAIAAQQLPDPKLRAGILNLPVEGPEAFTLGQEAMTMRMVGVMQEFPRREKRALRGRLLQLEGERGELELEFLRREFRRDAAAAWLDAWLPVRSGALIRALREETQMQIDAQTIQLRAGRASAADVAMLRVEYELLRDREQQALGEEQAARAMLSRWIGERASAPLPETLPDVAAPSLDVLRGAIDAHPHLNVFAMDAQIADVDARLARLASKPDWNIEVAYSQRGPAFSNMVSIQFGIDLPLFQRNRQDRTVLAKLAAANAARGMQEDNRREMRAEAARLHALFVASRDRARLFRERVLVEAQARLEAAAAAYRGGRGSLAQVLAARSALLDLEIEALTREAAATRSAIELAYFMHDDGSLQ
jgi:outer membrane protein TolC